MNGVVALRHTAVLDVSFLRQLRSPMGRRHCGAVRVVSLLSMLALAGGCAVPVPPVVVTSRPGVARPAAATPASQPAPGQVGAPGGPLSLAEAMARALASNPQLSVRQLEVRARQAEAAQAARPLNPAVSVDVEDLGRAGGIRHAQPDDDECCATV